MKKLKQIVIILLFAAICVGCTSLASTGSNPWKMIQLPTEATFADVAFTDDPKHGWLVGTKATLFETKDAGETWTPVVIDFGEEKISFTGISFYQQEGWITGDPLVLLHTTNGGKTWERVRLSAKLPGAPYGIIALGPKSAEMVTKLGAIYKTVDGGQNWKALVEGSVGVARTLNRSPNGEYVAVSARGNFYSTWEPGQAEWTPHDRTSSRRLQNMGFGKDGRLWLLARGGQLQFSEPEAWEEWGEVKYPEFSTSWGLLDMGYRTDTELWAAGGSGNLLRSLDDGETWEKDRDVENIASNFYRVVFISPEQGFVLGQNGILLKYEPEKEEA
ncbi:photosynthesis system II assembly factor Ycf48 [Gloeocapsa sp. PCC 73106]|uniref:photosynthesis system II assembly factor Ycf48 n=1 Tax=Gloeocapsa sp. PCC 73106 TaxID=102232 RepID=UPI0002AC796B|nr:photosynthesis system II assembly factor Ycf48 [Gloeocapsa sp. PCC 73106]ELR99418.1 putative photosystem II stability/assembly factor-like protein [Gloeocapsa sp. PCC 73106]